MMRHPTRGALLGLCLAVSLPVEAAGQTPPAPRLRTRWAAELRPDSVLPEYPRPQLVRRAWQNLNGPWDYALTALAAPRPDAWDGTILVPFAIESQLSGVMRAVTDSQRLWYRRRFTPPPLARGHRLLLHFGAVDWHAVVWVNGRQVGEHRGGYDPFTFDITDALRRGGEQELVVAAWDPTDRGEQPRGKQVLRPGSIWYTAVTGIWQTVWLEPVPATHVDRLLAVPDVDASTVTVTVGAAGTRRGTDVRVTLTDGGRLVATATGRTGRPLVLSVPHARLWSPDDPHLYDVHVRLPSGDSITGYVGMRKIAVERDASGHLRLFLNNRPLFQLGLLDQGWWPDGLYTAPTDEALRYDVEMTRRLGFNLARKHVKVEPARWYWHADRLGLLVWQDMPSGESDSPEGRATYSAELERVVEALRPFPSIVMWVPFNEGWGQHDTRRITDWLHTTDPTRLVNSASGWTDRGTGDVWDVHDYPGPRLGPADGRRARVLGEFGGLGLPLEAHTWLGRNNWGYRSYTSLDSLRAAYRALLGRLRPLVDSGLAAAVYTQTTDVEIEVNGVMTYDRAVVKLPDDAPALHAQLTGALAAAGRSRPMTNPGIRQEPFGRTPDGQDVELFTFTNAHGMEARVMTYGGILVSLKVPDRDGRLGDVVLGHDSLAGYLRGNTAYFGAIVGRYANRIAAARFTLDGRTYELAANNGPNTLHGGRRGFDQRVWWGMPFQRDGTTGVTMTYTSPDGEEGYPGALTVRVTYSLTERNELIVDYEATTDRATPVNLTQHSYFNLRGEGDVLGHVLTIDASRFTPVDAGLIPTGSPAPVEGTPFDFRRPVPIGARIADDDPQLRLGRGYDHNFVLDRPGSALARAARLEEPVSGRTLEVRTTEPGLQFYSGNFLDGSVTGKGGRPYTHRAGLCLETQHFPDSPNRPDFPSTILRPGETLRSQTVFAFGVMR